MDELTEHFTWDEFQCPCCNQCEMSPAFMETLEKLRVNYGKAFSPTSGYRCPKHNVAVGGRPNSFHMLGRAADIPVSEPGERWQFIREALALGLTVIVYPSFIHVDDREGRKLFLLS